MNLLFLWFCVINSQLSKFYILSFSQWLNEKKFSSLEGQYFRYYDTVAPRAHKYNSAKRRREEAHPSIRSNDSTKRVFVLV